MADFLEFLDEGDDAGAAADVEHGEPAVADPPEQDDAHMGGAKKKQHGGFRLPRWVGAADSGDAKLYKKWLSERMHAGRHQKAH